MKLHLQQLFFKDQHWLRPIVPVWIAGILLNRVVLNLYQIRGQVQRELRYNILFIFHRVGGYQVLKDCFNSLL